MDKRFFDYLNHAVQSARRDGFDRIELVDEDEVELIFCKGDTGFGSAANEYREQLWALSKKDLSQLKAKFKASKVSLQDYNHFGENARKLLIAFE